MERGHETIEDFEAFLSQTGLVRKDKIKYYAYWVNKFLNYSRYRPNKPLNQNIPSYLEKLEKDERIKAWQVKQAADAVLIYVEKFLCERKTSVPLTINTPMEIQEKSKSGQQSSNWEFVLSQFHNNIRLRHYSPRTEKSYRIWRGRFALCLK